MAITPPTTSQKEAQTERTRKMAVFVPIAAVPFMAVMFWVFGGGSAQASAAAAPPPGLNLELPKAGNSTITSSKIAAYASPVDTLRNRGLVIGHIDTVKTDGLAFGVGGPASSSTAKADEALAAAKNQLVAAQRQQSGQGMGGGSAAGGNGNSTNGLSSQQLFLLQQQQRENEARRTQEQLARVNQQAQLAMSNVSASGGSVNTRPVAVAVAAKKAAPETKASVVDNNAVVSHLGHEKSGKSASFQGLDSDGGGETDSNTLPAVIHESQEVTSGSLVKMRLTEPAVVNGHQLAANTFIYGKASLTGERLEISIETLKSGSNIFPVELKVYDVDGMEGLHIPGTMTRDAMKQAGSEGLGAADMLTMSSNPATAAAGVAIGAVKSLGQKKVRLIKVRLKAGYNIMLKVDKD